MAAAAADQQPQRPAPVGPPHYVDLHVNAGECVSLQLLDGQEQVVAGPATITMISQQQNPPVPIPVQVPPGHMIHQIADENGTLKHIILSIMESDDTSSLDSSVITLPHGTFRIDSHGELVSTSASDDACPLTTLPQQTYFANYDGCPVAYDATSLADPLEAPAGPLVSQPLPDPSGLSHNNGPIYSAGPMMAGPMQPNIGLALGAPMQPAVSSNGMHLPSSHLADKAHTHTGSKGPRGSSSNGYKQHKTISTSTNDTRQQASYSNYSNQSYNIVVSGHSHHHHHHHHHQQQSQQQQSNYHPQQASNDVSSPSSFKSQALLPNHQGSIVTGNYSPAYSTYNHTPTTLANVVSSKLVHNQAHQQLASYRNSDSSDNYMQRNREQVSYSHNNNNNSYQAAGVRSSSQHQHNNNENKRSQLQPLNDKTPSSPASNHNNNRYNATANVKVISNNHIISNNKQQHHHHQQSNGLRSNHYNSGHLHEQPNKEQAAIFQNIHQTANFHPNNPSTRDVNNMKSSKQQNIYTHDYNGPLAKHSINSAFYPPVNKGAGQTSNKLASSTLRSGPELVEKIYSKSTQELPTKQSSRVTRESGQVQVESSELAGHEEASTSKPKLDHSGEESESRTSRGKQKKCQIQAKNQVLNLESSVKQYKQQPADDIKSELKSITEPADRFDEQEGLDKSTSSVCIHEQVKNQANKEVKQQSKNSQKRNNRDKSAQLTNNIKSNEHSTRSEPAKNVGELELIEDQFIEDQGTISEMTVTTLKENTSDIETIPTSSMKSTSSKRSSDLSRTSESDNNKIDSQQSAGKNHKVKPTNESPARNVSKKVSASASKLSPSSSPKAHESKSSPELEELEHRQALSESQVDEELHTEAVLSIERVDSPALASPGSKSSITISMRTSLSENNIQSLDSVSSVKSTQTTPQKVTCNSDAGTSQGHLKSCVSELSKKKSDKRRGSSNKNEHQVKLSSMAQLRLLNLNCTSVTSSSVHLKWSYNCLAEKYGIHQHQGSSKNTILMDHFVIESSNSKNIESNTLLSPKIVYQGCAMSCRVNNISPDKIHHFKVRRTALVTVNKGTELAGEEHLVVSEILSVTLPSAHQQTKKGANNWPSQRQRSSSTDALSSERNQTLFRHEPVASAQQNTLSGSAYANRGNPSSQNNNSKSSISQPVKFSNIIRQCRSKFFTMMSKLVQNSLSSYSDAKFAGLLLVLFTLFAMLLAIFIHLYIVAPVTE